MQGTGSRYRQSGTRRNSLPQAQECLFLTLTASEWEDAGLGSRRNASVLHNGSETRPEVEGSEGERYSQGLVPEAGDEKNHVLST